MSTLSPPTISNVKTSKAGSKSKGKSRKHSKGFSLTGKSAMALVRPAIGTAIFAGLAGYVGGKNNSNEETVNIPVINKAVDVRLVSAGVLAGLGYFKPAIIAKHTALIHEGAQGALSAWSADQAYGYGRKMAPDAAKGVGAFWHPKEKRLENKKEKLDAKLAAYAAEHGEAPGGGASGSRRMGIDNPPAGMPAPVYVPGGGWTSAPRLYQTVRSGGQRQVVPANRRYLG